MTDVDGFFPEYSDSGLAGQAVLYSAVASVHFFVEDEDQENLYEVIISRALPKCRDFKIFPLGGKPNVLAHVAADYPILAGERRIYLLDKDFDDLLGTMISHEDVVYFDDYCVENALIEEDAICQLAVDESPKIKDVRARVGFDAALQAWMPDLDRLHRAFLLVQVHSLGLRNCDNPPDIFVSQSAPLRFDTGLVNAYVGQVVSALMARGLLTSADDYAELERAAFGSARKTLRNISGKFLLKTFLRHLRYEGVCGNVRLESATIRLARIARLRRLKGWRARVNARLAA